MEKATITTRQEYQIDIGQGTQERTLPFALTCGDKAALELTLTVTDEGAPVTGFGARVWGVRRGDMVSTFATATVTGNVAVVTLDGSFCAVPGRLELLVRLSSGTEVIATPLRISAVVKGGTTDVIADPGDIIPSIEELLAQIERMEAATEACTGAAQAASTAAQAAQAATEGAEAATGAAQLAAEKIDSMTVEADTLPAGSDATAAVSEKGEDQHKHVVFGIPRGLQGVQGMRGTVTFSGTAITGTSAEPTAYATGIEAAIVGDRYRYTGTEPAFIGNEYLCVAAGVAATALWVYDGCMRGAPGEGAVSTVNGVQADGDGNVTLGAGDLPTAGGSTVQAELEALDGGIAEITPRHAQVSLTAAGWSASDPYTQTVALPGAVGTEDVICTPAPESHEAYGNAGIRATALAAGEDGGAVLTFQAASVPEADVAANVMMLRGVEVSA